MNFTGIGKALPKFAAGLAAAFLFAVPSANSAMAAVVAKIDLSSQRMHVTVNGRHYATWRVSTARRGYRTPIGSYRPTVMKRMHYSSKYNNSPMPYSIFFRGGYAIHGTNHIRNLGRPASHGCVRLHPRHAATLYSLVKRHGPRTTRIRVQY